MTDKFFDQVKEELAGQVQAEVFRQARIKPIIPVAPPKAIPPEPSMTEVSVTSPRRADVGTVILSATPENAEVAVDGNFGGMLR